MLWVVHCIDDIAEPMRLFSTPEAASAWASKQARTSLVYEAPVDDPDFCTRVVQ